MKRWLPLGTLILGVIMVAAMFAPRLLTTPSDRLATAQPVASASDATRTDPKAAETIALASPFGRAAPQPAAVQTQALPELRLTGVVTAARPEASQAFIETPQGVQVYRIGDTVAAPFTLVQISPAQVTLTDGTTDHVLAFDALAGRQGIEAIPAARAEPYRTAAHRQISAPLKEPETTEDYIAYWRERVRRNPGEVLKEIGLQPTDGGYRIAQRQNIGVRLAGFRTGDLITSVNGLSVGQPDQDRKHLDQIAAEGLARIEFTRGGERMSLSFPLR
jgi:general secretion pathway protein C